VYNLKKLKGFIMGYIHFNNNIHKFLVYLSGPITGEHFDKANNWRDDLSRKLYNQSYGSIETLSPLRGPTDLPEDAPLEQNYENNPLTSIHGIMRRDFNDTVRSDLVIVNFNEAKKVSIGTVMEVAWAYYNDSTPVIIINNKENDLHSHIMLEEWAVAIVPDIDTAVKVACTTLLPDSSRFYHQKSWCDLIGNSER
jgi:nucleoside 2-deoxyribosyltransferase